MKLRSSNLASRSSIAEFFTPGLKNFPRKGRGLGHVALFKNFKASSIFLEGVKVHCLYLASGSTTANLNVGLEISPESGVVWVTGPF